jgi:hypothetical protein
MRLLEHGIQTTFKLDEIRVLGEISGTFEGNLQKSLRIKTDLPEGQA